MPNERILIVEDQEEVARFIENTLCALGYVATATADSGELAIQRAQEVKPDLVLMDIGLEGVMDGIEAARRIYSSLNIPVVFVTAMEDQGNFVRAKSAEGFGYVLKPFDSKTLGNAIEIALFQHYCGRKRALKAAQEAEEKCRTAYQNAIARLVFCTLDQSSLNSNPSLLGILGCDSYEALSAKVKAADEARCKVVESTTPSPGLEGNSNQLQSYTLHTYGPDGSTTWLSGKRRSIRKAGVNRPDLKASKSF